MIVPFRHNPALERGERGFNGVRVERRERSHFSNLTPDFFHHKPSVSTVTDFQPALRDNEDLIGAARSVPVSQDGPRSCPKPIFSAL